MSMTIFADPSSGVLLPEGGRCVALQRGRHDRKAPQVRISRTPTGAVIASAPNSLHCRKEYPAREEPTWAERACHGRTR